MLIEFFNNPWIDTILILILFLVGSKVLTFIIEKVVKVFVKKTKTKLDDLLIQKLDRVAVWFLFFIGIRIFVIPLLKIEILDKINNAFIILFTTWIIVKIVDVFIEVWGVKFAKRTKSKVDEALLSLFHKFSRIALFAIGIILVLNNFSIEITPFIASLGIAGIVIAFAIQSTLSNIFGGISLILDKNFKVGDVVKLESGPVGSVIDIGIRSTKIKTYDNEMLIIPNGKLSESIIQNFAEPDLSVRGVIPFGVEYGSDVNKVRKVVIDTLMKIEKIIKNDVNHPVEVLFINMGDFSLNFEARFWVASYTERFYTKVQATEEIYKNLTKSKIGIPFPTRTVYLKKEV